MFISEKNFREELEKKVLPYLASHGGERFLEREPGRPIRCLCYRAERPRGVVVISHGYTEMAEKYLETIYYFLRSGFSVWLAEHCGHGRSYRLTEDLSLVHIDRWERYVQDLLYTAHLAKRESGGLPLYLFGHSMGGGIAAAALSMEPQLFSKAVLSSPMIRPLTGKVPWKTAIRIAHGYCLAGKSKHYVAGQKPYEEAEPERYEDCNCLSPARFSYYRECKEENPLFHLNAASYGWLYQSAALNHYLQHTAWKRIQTPVLMFQAGREQMVSKKEQDRFARKLAARGKLHYIHVRGAKHEIFCGSSGGARRCWRAVLQFYLT